ncbi:MAG: hypothetical protein ACW98Y_10290 [Candidatus Thorarchaeota archaeon]
MHVCHSCESKLGLKKKDPTNNRLIPPDVMPLIFSAKSAAEEVGVCFELIDVNQLPISKRLRMMLFGNPIPRVSIGERYLIGSPTKHEIVELYELSRRL